MRYVGCGSGGRDVCGVSPISHPPWRLPPEPSSRSSAASKFHPLADPLFSLGDFAGAGVKDAGPPGTHTAPDECEVRKAVGVTGEAAGLHTTAHCAGHKSRAGGFPERRGRRGEVVIYVRTNACCVRPGKQRSVPDWPT